MRTWLLALAVSTAAALRDTSPFVLVSNNRKLEIDTVDQPHESAMNWVEESLLANAVKGCPYSAYVFVSQPELGERDVNEKTMPFLNSLVTKSKSVKVLPTIKDGAEYRGLAEQYVIDNCQAVTVNVDANTGNYEHYIDSKPRILKVDFKDNADLTKNDESLRNVVDHLASGNFLVVYRSTPREATTIGVDDSQGASPSHPADQKYHSLFENYVFFSPGVWMGASVALLLGSIFFISLDWLQSLMVSYKAFEKPSTK